MDPVRVGPGSPSTWAMVDGLIPLPDFVQHGSTMSHKVSPAPGNAPTTPDVKETTLGLGTKCYKKHGIFAGCLLERRSNENLLAKATTAMPTVQ